MTAQSAIDTLPDLWWIALGVALPFLYPFFVAAGAAKWFKFTVSMVMALAVAVVSMIGLDWSDITTELVASRLFTFAGIIQPVYVAADLFVTAWLNEEGKGLNDHEFYRPDRGLSERSLVRR